MDALSITQLSQFSGVKAHTIRIWEQRYNALSPDRSEGNVRTYNGLQLRRLLNIVSLLEMNYKISSVATLSDDSLHELIQRAHNLQQDLEANSHISQLISHGMRYDELEFSRLLDKLIEESGVVEVYKQVVYPLINRVGLMWSANMLPPAQEHFISNLIRQKILSLTENLPKPKIGSKKWVLLLPEGEFHEMGLFIAHYVLKLKGYSVVYLGANVPLETLNVALREIKPDSIFLFFVHNDFPENAQKFIDEIKIEHITNHLFMSGNHKIFQNVKLSKRMKWVKDVQDLFLQEEQN